MTDIDKFRHLILSGLIVFSLLCPAQVRAQMETGANTGQVFVLVRLTDYAGLTTYKSATPEEFRELANAAKKDNQMLPTAYANLRKEWRLTQNKGGQSHQVNYKVPAPSFPLKCPPPREVKQVGSFATAEELEKAKVPLEENEKNREDRLIKEKEAKEAAAESKGNTISSIPQETSGLKRPPPKPSTKRVKRGKPVSPVSEEDMLNNLIKEIERLTIEHDAAGAAGGLRGSDGSTMTPAAANAKAGSRGHSKTGTRVIKRIGE